MELQKRNGHSVLYLGREQKSIRVPENTSRKVVALILADLPPRTHNRRAKSIAALQRAGIAAS